MTQSDKSSSPVKILPSICALALALAIGPTTGTHAAERTAAKAPGLIVAQAMVPPTGMMDANTPTPMEQRYLHRYPQAARVGDLVGLPVLDLNGSIIGYVRKVVRTQQGKIELIVSYSRWWGWFGRLVAVPIEALGIEGRQLVSLDMAPSAYAAAPTWQGKSEAVLPADALIRVALART